MELKKWAEFSVKRVRTHGFQALPLLVRDLVSTGARLTGLDAVGDCVYDYEWDYLIVLDACRHDLYQQEIGRGEQIKSCASTSREWMDKNFGNEYESELRETAYVTGNPFSKTLNKNKFGLLEEVWKYAWDGDQGTIHPRPITDTAIRIGREHTFQRTIIHYMQPHYPFIAEGYQLGKMSITNHGTDTGGDVWDLVALGKLDKSVVLDAYAANLRFIYSHIQTLLSNIDGTAVITADHGNALGEYGIWGHPAHIPISGLRDVPWDEYECRDNDDYSPEDWTSKERPAESVTDRLGDLGYR